MQAEAYLWVKLYNIFQGDLGIKCRLLLFSQRIWMQLLKYLLLLHFNYVYGGVLVIGDGKIGKRKKTMVLKFGFVFIIT